ncbi:efflux RND transporter periplasmic adaptor subunit [Chitinophaga oryziterrae]|uniref:Efflux RND transporter periplasmic adaptor subunit n=1 Tax=Chitinophaga oryziterrae TaxID=1031224 RepID=A0A6N8J5T1_9BACT|nr:efflux RND transporter periplasmic adaptor subunit [Chitinophaga oryziterrae]MVT39569.1 efflux RND transporter periplasmic adaptor subunit [Chitinophaga oryziterrae]
MYPTKNIFTFSAVAIITFFISSCSSNHTEAVAATEVKKLAILTLEERTVTGEVVFPAHIEGKVNVDIKPQVDGYIEKIYVEEGAAVKKGAPLFKIEDAVYIQQLNNAQANLSIARAAMKSAALEVEKQTELNNSKVTSDFPLKTASVAFESAQANVALQTSIVEAARINLNFTLIKAPVDGMISRIPKRKGNLASKSDATALTTLSDISEVYAYFSMTEKDFLQFNLTHAGKTVPQIIAALPDVSLLLADGNRYGQPGKIQIVDGQFNTGTGAISLRAMFRNPKLLLRSGNTGRISLPETTSKALLVPVSATVDMQNKVFVYRLTKDNKAERVAVVVSATSGDDYVIREGLKAGDRIIAKEVSSVIEGESIQPIVAPIQQSKTN